eukprot:4333142-Pleurochrysis_carterae.AAC.3
MPRLAPWARTCVAGDTSSTGWLSMKENKLCGACRHCRVRWLRRACEHAPREYDAHGARPLARHSMPLNTVYICLSPP